MAYSHRDIIRHYSDNLRNGATDTDLTPRQRRIAAVILATASNDILALTDYPAPDSVRVDIARRTVDALWNGNAMALMQAIGPSAAADYGIASDRAATILRNV
jgi:hypothetical protein